MPHRIRITTAAMILAGLLTAAGHAQDKPKADAPAKAEPKIVTETITYEHGGVKLEGLLAYDKNAQGKRPGVLVCHEWWGNTDYSRGRAKQLAELGYVAFALDMYGQGKTSMEVPKAQEWSRALYTAPGLMGSRAAAGLKILTDRPEVDPARVAAIGYCMGGTVALELARTGADVKAITCFHTSGLAAAKPEDNRKIKARILIAHGAADPLVEPEVIKSFKTQMADAGVTYEFIEYPDAKHSFTNPKADAVGMEAVGYNKAADEKSWEDMKKLFAATIE